MSTYNPSIPLSTDLISDSQSEILGNFGQLNTQFGIDHIAFNTGSGNGTGFHKQVTFTAPLGSDPTPSSTQGILYTKTAASSSKTELFFDSLNSTPANVVQQLTGNLVTGTDSLGNPDYTIKTPFGLIFKFGGDTFNQAGTAMTFSTPFPNNFLGVVMACRHVGAISSSYNVQSVAGFTGSCQQGTTAQFISWFAWGN